MTQVLQRTGVTIDASNVRDVIGEHLLADGFELVLDLDASTGCTLVDARDGTRYLDLFTFFASNALGMNHPALIDDPEFRADLMQAAMNKPSNSDIYTVPMARFVDTFARVLGDARLPHLFFVEGGALAVENALKVAFDWKSRWNERNGIDPSLGSQVMHFEHAFHGRSGYTMSLTNTDPNKVARFPKFDWPRIPSPFIRSDKNMDELEDASLAAARMAFEANPHDIACAIIEPIQGEGGDHHFRPRFLQKLRELCHEFDALFVMDEVQTGAGMTGTAWAFQQLGVVPDVVAFGKKVQVCGVMAGGRVDDIDDNVFAVSSRINSTWGGNLTDMVRSRRILEVVESEKLIDRAGELGAVLLNMLQELATRHTAVSEVRGRGLMCAFSLPDASTRDRVIELLRTEEHVLALGCGESAVRFRPALTITETELTQAVDSIDRVLRML
ncbi:L-lysine 6-transaminase [Rhodococcus sp. 15-725-2-2b]|uniref:L-lysine 6-transaminase n=1 Tax=unclassified Rhodococcus (in: high G+C Gram-positive bacteria) TaxID=192944 RepID=UPI000B9C0CE4|nr:MULTISPECIES: L-lysine 6-transaminase [unclassified Rhodococcus (in: high G+C Gram-positive bacteria)]OZC69258.1 L-lysine 6-transaminase [Rhodococcus sp. 06-469-3-2]OZD45731.1 L-lysine 6-transaminase [Rhodococcus sp. 06-1477-1A]OZE75738.1 L-lysine 6-transaminase [Rhodococcus sp. 15-725-2-2b]